MLERSGIVASQIWRSRLCTNDELEMAVVYFESSFALRQLLSAKQTGRSLTGYSRYGCDRYTGLTSIILNLLILGAKKTNARAKS